MPQAVGGMVRNQNAAPALGESLQLVQPVDQLVVAIQVREEDVVVAFHRAVALVAKNRGELARVVKFASQPDDVGPARFRHREAVPPLVFDLAVVFAHIRPVRVWREGVEVEVVAGHLETALQGALGITDLVVVVQVAEVVLVRCRCRLCRRGSSGRHGAGQGGPGSGMRTMAHPVAPRDPVLAHSYSVGVGSILGAPPHHASTGPRSSPFVRYIGEKRRKVATLAAAASPSGLAQYGLSGLFAPYPNGRRPRHRTVELLDANVVVVAVSCDSLVDELEVAVQRLVVAEQL